MTARPDSVEISRADESWAEQMAPMWAGGTRKNFHLQDGFSVVAHCRGRLLGYISVVWRDLPMPLTGSREAFIDFIGVREELWRQGVARRLVAEAECIARNQGVCQIRAWSSQDKTAAIPMWRALGFALCPADPRDEGGRGYYVAKRLDQ